MNALRIALLSFLVLAISNFAQAVVINVTADHPTIQEAINAASDYDEVLVANGTYAGSGNTDIDFLGKAITVRSANGPGSCIIDNTVNHIF